MRGHHRPFGATAQRAALFAVPGSRAGLPGALATKLASNTCSQTYARTLHGMAAPETAQRHDRATGQHPRFARAERVGATEQARAGTRASSGGPKLLAK